MYVVKKMSWRFIEIASDVYGGIGGSIDLPLQSFTRRAFVWLPPGGTPTSEAMGFSQMYNDHTM